MKLSKLSKLAKRMANDLCIFEDGLSIQDCIYALEDKEQISKLLEKYTLEEIKQVYDELSYVNKLLEEYNQPYYFSTKLKIF